MSSFLQTEEQVAVSQERDEDRMLDLSSLPQFDISPSTTLDFSNMPKFDLRLYQLLQRGKQNEQDQETSIISPLFPNDSDHAEFVAIFSHVEASKLIQNLQIPHMISKEIAEFATGKIATCNNPKCKHEILVLHKHKERYFKIAGNREAYEDELMRSPVPYIYHSHWDGIEAHRYVQCVQHEEYEWARIIVTNVCNRSDFSVQDLHVIAAAKQVSLWILINANTAIGG
eukprot:CAMPEP_0197050202 /NCGR_PEP_ID=MMETSP1384-20130603/25152_1 /TAXON_ID=29189 /ORGANISM="Ammonia sp." /LENGTH=227 /DNA_ID=CAMNT_0042482575 /DNA_START=63 /DNA_END=747 /DNA_ORIENTATION=+